MPKQPTDWRPADIAASVHKLGITLSALALRHGYCESAARVALCKPWPAVEQLIADAIGTRPQKIWPTRYREDGTHKCERPSSKSSTRPEPRNVQRTVAA